MGEKLEATSADERHVRLTNGRPDGLVKKKLDSFFSGCCYTVTMRFIREPQTLERRESTRSHLKKWLDMNRNRGVEAQCLEEKQSEVRHALFLSIIRRANSVSLRAPSLKKTQSPLAVKWSTYIAAIGLKDSSSKPRRLSADGGC